MAGVINAPGGKYGHWTDDDLPPTPDQWFSGAAARQGSWWPIWDEWVTAFASGRTLARQPGDGGLTVIEDAPGSYARVRSDA
jgi:polyhydroxyalkanoate synthase